MAQPEFDSSHYTMNRGVSPLVATAIHAGSRFRFNLSDYCALTHLERLREEDPYTDHLVSVTDNQVIAHHSRFEFDINRSRTKAIYRKPEDAWGLKVWKDELPEALAEESLTHYDMFYNDLKEMLTGIHQRHNCFVVYDIHTYNVKREGPECPEADPMLNPEINIGTGNMNRKKFAPVVDALATAMEGYDYNNRRLDVRENVKFQGGHFMRWIHDNFPNKVCVISIEFKKFFMDEWTGEPDLKQVEEVKKLLETTVEPVLAALAEINKTEELQV